MMSRLILGALVVGGLLVAAGCGSDDPPAARMDTASRPEGGAAAAASPGDAPLPEAVSPFPAGLSGTLVFQSDREGRTKIYTLDLATGRVGRLTSDVQYRDEHPRWSPDGSRILFRSNRAHYGPSAESGSPDYDLYVMNATGGDVRRLTTDAANENEGTWMPDGRSIVYSSDRDSRGDLYRLWLDDGRVERLTRHFVGRAIMPAASPDGRQVAFAAQTLRRGQFWLFQVHLLDMASGKTTPLDNAGGSCWPAWGPQGDRLAYVLLDREPSALEMVALGSRERRPLLGDPERWSYYPDFSPDGQWLAFSVSPEHHEGEDWDLAVMPVDRPGDVRVLTKGRGNDRLPDWKPGKP